MRRSLELRRQRAAIVNEMQDLTKNSGAWNANGNGARSAAQNKWHDLDAQQKSLERDIYRAEADELGEQMRHVTPPPQGPEGRITGTDGWPAFERRSKPQQEQYSENRSLLPFAKDLESAEYRTAFDRYLRGGTDALNSQQRNMLTDLTAEVRTYSGLSTSTSGDAAGYTIPIAFQRELEVRLKFYGGMRKVCRVLATSAGNILDWPAMDDTSATGEWLAEANPVSQLNPAFSQVQFNSFLCSSRQVLISLQVLQDNAVNLEGVLGEAFAIRIGRTSNLAYTVGAGVTEPQGIITAILADAVPNIVQATGSGTNDGISGNTEANSIGSDDLENLVAALDENYRPGASFMFHTKTGDALRKIKDKYGRPLWSASMAASTPNMIFGYPYTQNNDLDQIGAGKYPVLFGDFSKHVIRDAGGISVFRFNEAYMASHQIAFQAWLRTDSRRIQQSAFALLRNPLS
jgi:HK97 family phage major capsid protein